MRTVRSTRAPVRSRARRFRATIRKQGPNPYVDVPPRISRAFAGYSRSGRITVVGKLDHAPIRATLVPVRAGRHRLFLSGGPRSAAGVGPGDVVTIEVRATAPEAVRPPADVAAALARSGVRAAFDALTPSHRLELLRYVADARSPAGRKQRIAESTDYVRGRTAPATRKAAARPLWTCPRCGNTFAHRNQYHSCARHHLSEPFRGKPAAIRALFDRFRAIVEACGPVKTVAYHDRVGFMARVRFAVALPCPRWLDVAFSLPRRIESRRFRRVETISPHAHLHVLRVSDPRDLDREVAAWVREAYAAGRGG